MMPQISLNIQKKLLPSFRSCSIAEKQLPANLFDMMLSVVAESVVPNSARLFRSHVNSYFSDGKLDGHLTSSVYCRVYLGLNDDTTA